MTDQNQWQNQAWGTGQPQGAPAVHEAMEAAPKIKNASTAASPTIQPRRLGAGAGATGAA